MYYAYILKSIKFPNRLYYGSTSSLRIRLNTHNQGLSSHTHKYKPWKVIFYAAFESKGLAMKFEQYMKSASGKAFLRKRLIEV